MGSGRGFTSILWSSFQAFLKNTFSVYPPVLYSILNTFCVLCCMLWQNTQPEYIYICIICIALHYACIFKTEDLSKSSVSSVTPSCYIKLIYSVLYAHYTDRQMNLSVSCSCPLHPPCLDNRSPQALTQSQKTMRWTQNQHTHTPDTEGMDVDTPDYTPSVSDLNGLSFIQNLAKHSCICAKHSCICLSLMFFWIYGFAWIVLSAWSIDLLPAFVYYLFKWILFHHKSDYFFSSLVYVIQHYWSTFTNVKHVNEGTLFYMEGIRLKDKKNYF